MDLSELNFAYPEHLVATERLRHSRVMWVEGAEPCELASVEELLARFAPGDLLVVNDTKVLKRRVFAESGLEILFLNPVGDCRQKWHVLCPSSRWKAGVGQTLPHGVRLELIERGRTQVIEASEALTDLYFEKCGEMPLPPYIQKARGERHNRGLDSEQYQTAWAAKPGSLAAPTASLHFQAEHLARLKAKGVFIAKVTLHVGLGTFLPITVQNLNDHLMHEEIAEIPAETWGQIQETRRRQCQVWALGTTVTRTLESAAQGRLRASEDGGFFGATDLFIRPGFEFQIVDRLLTNFHQPESTLLALVGAFAGLDNVKACYQWAIERGFRLFSYGDLSVWIK